MGRGLRLSMFLVVALLASAAPAIAQDWTPGSGSGDPGWTDPSNGDPGWTDPGTTDQGPSDPGSNGDGWNPSQGDPQETHQIWDQSPPVDQPPWNGNGHGNGGGDWPQVAPLPISKTPTVAGKTAM